MVARKKEKCGPSCVKPGFDPAALDETLRDNGLFRHNIAMGPAFATRVNSLIIPNWRTYDLVRRNAWRDSRASAA